MEHVLYSGFSEILCFKARFGAPHCELLLRGLEHCRCEVRIHGHRFCGRSDLHKVLSSQPPLEDALKETTKCQAEVHAWGRGNRVLFGAGKESFQVLHRTRGQGENFTILGTEFDTTLGMHDAAHKVSTEAGWRLKTLPRTRRHRSLRESVGIRGGFLIN